jgi:A/G-specific adenine glycosylase
LVRRAPTPHHTVTAGIIWRDNDRLLITQRPLEGLLGGLWEFPGGKQEPRETLQQCLKRELYEELQIEVSVGAELAVVKHAFTHFRVTLHAFECQYLSTTEPKAIEVNDWRWVTLDELGNFAFPVMDQKIIAALCSARQPRLPYLESREDRE